MIVLTEPQKRGMRRLWAAYSAAMCPSRPVQRVRDLPRQARHAGALWATYTHLGVSSATPRLKKHVNPPVPQLNMGIVAGYWWRPPIDALTEEERIAMRESAYAGMRGARHAHSGQVDSLRKKISDSFRSKA